LARRFAHRLNLAEPESPVVPILVGEAGAALAASAALEELGFLVLAIRPPTVPDGTARLRVTFTAQHTEDDADRLADAIGALQLEGPRALEGARA
jgi:8-amino-7-oxononanoate synthase